MADSRSSRRAFLRKLAAGAGSVIAPPKLLGAMQRCPPRVLPPISVGEVADAVVHIDFNNEEGAKGGFMPLVRDINVERVSSRKSRYALNLRGFPGSPIIDVRLTDCQFHGVAKGSVVENVRGLQPERVSVNGKPVDASSVMKPGW